MRVAARSEGRPRGVVEVRDADGVASIHDIDQEPPARPPSIHGQQDGHVRREGNPTRRIPRSQLDVGDGAIRRVLRIDREVDPAQQLLVAARIAKGAPPGERTTLRHLKARDRHDRLLLARIVRRVHERDVGRADSVHLDQRLLGRGPGIVRMGSRH